MDVCCFLDVLLVTVGSVLSTHNTIFTFYCFQRTICRRFHPKCLFSSHRVCVRFNKKNRLTFPQRKVTSSASSTSRRALNRVWSLNESNHLIIYHSAFQFTSIFITSSFFFPPINFLFLPRLGDDSEQLPCSFILQMSLSSSCFISGLVLKDKHPLVVQMDLSLGMDLE